MSCRQILDNNKIAGYLAICRAITFDFSVQGISVSKNRINQMKKDHSDN